MAAPKADLEVRKLKTLHMLKRVDVLEGKNKPVARQNSFHLKQKKQQERAKQGNIKRDVKIKILLNLNEFS
ncbi:MAG: hypothetical protein BGO77_00875 [Caedibacter sp. 37-49]|nr:MAG: hypothetical protein BGO77_00875 [Caedibacter sp. 37-49]